ncbi:hypothetical protein QPK14_03365 [Photorhabdus temperata subsp. temperata]
MGSEDSVIDGMRFSDGRWSYTDTPSSRHSLDNGSSFKQGGGNGGGDGMLEARVARLESDVEHIKKSIDEIKLDFRDAKKDISATAKKIAEMEPSLLGKIQSTELSLNNSIQSVESSLNNKIQSVESTLSNKVQSVELSLSEKISSVDKRIDGTKVWFLSILVFSIAMPIIMFLLNLYLKK